jgi:hypothetical protein
MRGVIRHWRIGLLAGTVACVTALQTSLAVGEEAPVVSPLIVQSVAPIRSVVGADGLTHLVYELLLVNQSPLVATVDSVAVLDGNSGAILRELAGDDLPMVLRLNLFGGKGTTLQPSQSAFVFVDATVASDAPVPASVKHRIVATQSAPAEAVTGELGGLAISLDAGGAATVAFVTAPMPVDPEPAVVLAPPVHGANWVMFRGCCDLATSHRGGTGAYDGSIYIAERFAVDFVRLGAGDYLITGPGNEVTSYPQYGQPVFAVADGTVVSASNAVPEQPPGALPEGISPEMAGGNAVLLDIGDGRFAFYAHMQPGSVRVEAGDAVKAGDQIGLIGNSGKTIGPHLHFHLIDRASSLAGDGLPFVFADFVGQGVLADDALMLAFQGQPAPVDTAKLAGPHANQHPLNNQVVDFGE